MTVAFQGDHYAFSELAAFKFFRARVKGHPCQKFEQVFSLVQDQTVQYGIIPIENSSTGSIHKNYDLLLQHELTIVGEVYLRIDHHLIANPGVTLEDIELIYSHPQALEQCRVFLATLSTVQAVPNYDTAGSVKKIRDEKSLHAAAIASHSAAEDYGMHILKSEIQDIKENITRFLLISARPAKPGKKCKTSIVFAMKNMPGALYKSLSAFALRDIDLCKIESRPLRGKPWQYFFYLDFSGHMEDAICQNAIRHLQEMTSFLRILGSYNTGEKTATL
ncbi:prephenate dehydratase [candidate division KSB1 bacterium]|nr:prephenate dehydratase [candidate division KSB1 bacterium]